MKIIVEISDENLRFAIETQVEKAVAEMTTAAIKAKMDNILQVKFDRIDDPAIERAIGIAAAAYVKGNATGYALDGRVDKALAAAARELVRGRVNSL